MERRLLFWPLIVECIDPKKTFSRWLSNNHPAQQSTVPHNCCSLFNVQCSCVAYRLAWFRYHFSLPIAVNRLPDVCVKQIDFNLFLFVNVLRYLFCLLDRINYLDDILYVLCVIFVANCWSPSCLFLIIVEFFCVKIFFLLQCEYFEKRKDWNLKIYSAISFRIRWILILSQIKNPLKYWEERN